MNLGKLLGAGKSFISGRKSAAYRTDKRVYLPQFVSPKNPFATPASPEARIESPPLAGPPPVSPIKKAAPLTWAKTEKMPILAAPAAPLRRASWAGKLNPVSLFRSAPAPAGNRPAPVQAELSLEKVRVVHNDLTDADVEVVPLKSRPAPALLDPMPARGSWEALGDRILKVTAL